MSEPFHYDQSSLPLLPKRRALVAVDLQRDFTTAEGRLPVTEPSGYVQRTIELARQIRQTGGEVVWAVSQFNKPQEHDDIITSTKDTDDPVDSNDELDEEAFLSHKVPTCVQSDSPGLALDPTVEKAKQATDLLPTAKSTYSAFASSDLLHKLRVRMVMEVFICGSLANVGVYATALGAAANGQKITIVEDCCGYRDEARQRRAIKNLVELIGCEVASSAEVLEMINPPVPSTSQKASKSSPRSNRDKDKPKERVRGRKQASTSPGISSPMSNLQLTAEPSEPVAINTDAPSGSTSMHPGAKAESQDGPSKMREAAAPSLVPPTGLDFDTQGALEVDQDYIKPLMVDTKGKQLEDPTALTSPSKREATAQLDLLKRDSSPRKVMKMTPKVDPPSTEVPPSTKDGSTSSSQKGLCEGDTDIIENLLPEELENGVIEKLHSEIQWKRMSHQGGEVPRLVAVQGQIAADGSIPIYRHPSDASPPLLPFSPTVLKIKAVTERQLGHPLNHVLIQHYRDGNDYISEHSDKTLDIVKGSYIANVSLGAERTMVLRTKRQDKDPSWEADNGTPPDTKRKIQRARLPHNSLCRMGLQTNMKWLHAIRPDKRTEREKTPAELANNGGRISLTFRQIGTFLDKDEKKIWGQGATSKTIEEARAVINGQGPEAIKMLQAFGAENHSSAFDWETRYGEGFDVLHMSSSPRFFSSGDSLVDGYIGAMLRWFKIQHAKGSMGPAPKKAAETELENVLVKFLDADEKKSEVQGDLAILLYLDAKYGSKDTGIDLAKKFTLFQQSLGLVNRYRKLLTHEKPKFHELGSELDTWNDLIEQSSTEFLAGEKPSLPDFVLHSVLDNMLSGEGESTVLEGLDSLKLYHKKLKGGEDIKEARKD